jgi:hypothetical protein
MLVAEADTWNRIIRQGEGYIYNDFGTQFPGESPTWKTSDFNVLHRASCSHIRRMTYSTEGKLTKHFFESRRKAIEWLETNRREHGYSLCSYCNP